MLARDTVRSARVVQDLDTAGFRKEPRTTELIKPDALSAGIESYELPGPRSIKLSAILICEQISASL